MEKQFPKNVRQVGNVCDTPKIYVEDYVDTYLNQIKEQSKEPWTAAFLVGERVEIEGVDCVFITGAVRSHVADEDVENVHIDDEVMTRARKECGDYFPGQEIIGWMLVENTGIMGISNSILRIHEAHFTDKNSVFIQKHPVENEEDYYVFKFKELMQLGGHYIFYEKNPAMQNYMINVRRQIGVTPSEMVEDRAAKDFRNTIRGRKEVREQKNSSRLAYMTSVLLVVIVLAIGISAMNNYEKMNSVQHSIETLSETVKRVENGQAVNELVTEETHILTEGESVTEQMTEDASAEQTEASAVPEEGGTKGQGMEPEVSTIQEELKIQEYYIVEQGDTLDIISQKIYGTTGETEAICKMNGLTDGNLIFIGQKLLLP